MTAFIGVRISWLIDARNCDFILDASIALSRAAASSTAASSRSVTSCTLTTRPSTDRSRVRSVIEPSIDRQVPSRVQSAKRTVAVSPGSMDSTGHERGDVRSLIRVHQGDERRADDLARRQARAPASTTGSGTSLGPCRRSR